MQAAVKRAEELGAIAPGEASWDPHATSQLRPTPADERHPDQLSFALAGAQLDTDDAGLPRACAGSDGKPSNGTLIW